MFLVVGFFNMFCRHRRRRLFYSTPPSSYSLDEIPRARWSGNECIRFGFGFSIVVIVVDDDDDDTDKGAFKNEWVSMVHTLEKQIRSCGTCARKEKTALLYTADCE